MRDIIKLSSLLLAGSIGGMVGCWDVIEHEYDCDPRGAGTSADEAATDDGVDTDTSNQNTTDGVKDTDKAAFETEGQGLQIPGWEGMGRACETNEDCADLPGGGQCIKNLMSIINAPRGFCVACCNKAAIDGCTTGIDCVGTDDILTVCINTCVSDDDCREDYECTPVPVLDSYYVGRTYCMPDKEHAIVPEGLPESEPECDWPWVSR